MNDLDSGWVAHRFQDAICNVESEYMRPAVIFRPRVFKDGTEWCCLYGDDLAIGVAGFGHNPDEATRRFDAAWYAK